MSFLRHLDFFARRRRASYSLACSFDHKYFLFSLLFFNGFLYSNSFTVLPRDNTTISALKLANMRLTALFPLACAIVGFVLSMLCLFAGSKKSFMEDYHIITVGTPFPP